MPAEHRLKEGASARLDLVRIRLSGQEDVAIPADRRDVGPVPLQATLREARDVPRQRRLQVLYVTRPAAPGIPGIYGILTAIDIEHSYQQ